MILFWLFNAAMAVWVATYWTLLNGMQAGSEAEHAGKVIGGSIGTGIILFIWVAGAVILGFCALLTRGRKSIIIEDA